jgi:predicted DNA binding protein
MNNFAKAAKLTREAFFYAVYDCCRELGDLEYKYQIDKDEALEFYNDAKKRSDLTEKQTKALKKAINAEEEMFC